MRGLGEVVSGDQHETPDIVSKQNCPEQRSEKHLTYLLFKRRQDYDYFMKARLCYKH